MGVAVAVAMVAVVVVIYPSGAQRGVSRGEESVRGADLLLVNGKIWTGEPEGSGFEAKAPTRYAEAVAVAGGRILDVGTTGEMEKYRGSATEMIDAEGHLGAPRFLDSHVHVVGGSCQLLEIDLKHTRNDRDVAERVGEKADGLPPGLWRIG